MYGLVNVKRYIYFFSTWEEILENEKILEYGEKMSKDIRKECEKILEYGV